MMIQLLTLLVVGAVVGVTAERLAERAMPFGWIGAITAGLLGAWLMTDGFHIAIAPQWLATPLPLVADPEVHSEDEVSDTSLPKRDIDDRA